MFGNPFPITSSTSWQMAWEDSEPGEVAAHLAVEKICASLPLSPPLFLKKMPAGSFSRCNGKSQITVLRKSLHSPSYTGMGTTLSCFLVLEKTLIYAPRRNSRLYRLRSGSPLQRLTEDHSVRNAFWYNDGSTLPCTHSL